MYDFEWLLETEVWPVLEQKLYIWFQKLHKHTRLIKNYKKLEGNSIQNLERAENEKRWRRQIWGRNGNQSEIRW